MTEGALADVRVVEMGQLLAGPFLRSARGQELARSLIATADVLIENFRPGTLERWGLSPEQLRAGNSGLIIARVTGYGQPGPYAGRAGFGSIGEAMGGIRYVTGDPGMPPSRAGISLGDELAGTFALSDPHFRARQAIIRMAHPEFGEIPMQNVVPRLSATPGTVQSLGPELGQHNAEIYGRLLRLSAAEIAALAAGEVI